MRSSAKTARWRCNGWATDRSHRRSERGRARSEASLLDGDRARESDPSDARSRAVRGLLAKAQRLHLRHRRGARGRREPAWTRPSSWLAGSGRGPCGRRSTCISRSTGTTRPRARYACCAGLYGVDPTSARKRWAFIGDSENDESCFAAFHTTSASKISADGLRSRRASHPGRAQRRIRGARARARGTPPLKPRPASRRTICPFLAFRTSKHRHGTTSGNDPESLMTHVDFYALSRAVQGRLLDSFAGRFPPTPVLFARAKPGGTLRW